MSVQILTQKSKLKSISQWGCFSSFFSEVCDYRVMH